MDRSVLFYAALGLSITSSTFAFAQSIDDALGGFDEPTPTQIIVQQENLSPWSLSGSASFAAAYDFAQPAPGANGADHRGLSRVRPKVSFKIKGDLPDALPVPVRVLAEISAAHETVYQIRGQNDYTATLKNSFERDINLGEVYIGTELTDQLELTIGRQIVVWGTSENLRVVDVLNPLDRREIGMVDIENLRLPLAMVRADYVTGPWIATTMIIPQIRFNRQAPAGSPYDITNGDAPKNDVPADGLGNAELAASLRGNFSGWDLSFHAANLYNDSGHKETVDGVNRIRHSRVNMLGITADVALGNWLIKGEAAQIYGLQTLGLPNTDFTRSDVLTGVEFTGITNGSLSFEIVNRHVHNWSQALAAEGLKKDSQEYALRFSGDYMHERLHVTALTTRLSPLSKGGGFSRLSVEYDIQDALSITGGLVTYHDGTRSPFNAIGNNDRLFFEIKQSF